MNKNLFASMLAGAIGALIVVLLCGASYYTNPQSAQMYPCIRKVKVPLNSDATGATTVSLGTSYYSTITESDVRMNGYVLRIDVWSDPTSTPTTLWDMVVVDADSEVDSASNLFANIDSSSRKGVRFGKAIELTENTQLVCTNMGIDKLAYALLYIYSWASD